MRSCEQIFPDMNQRRPSAIGSPTITTAFVGFRFASGLQGYGDESDVDVFVSVKRNSARDCASGAAPAFREVDPDRHCSYQRASIGLGG